MVCVGDKFFLTASSFNAVPALPILHSRNLVNWRIINHAVDELPPDFDRPQHGNGVWAPSINYHEGTFYIFYGDPDRGVYMTKTPHRRSMTPTRRQRRCLCSTRPRSCGRPSEDGGGVQFSYATNDSDFEQIGTPLQAQKGRRIGAKIGLFTVQSAGPSVEDGHFDFEYFCVGE